MDFIIEYHHNHDDPVKYTASNYPGANLGLISISFAFCSRMSPLSALVHADQAKQQRRLKGYSNPPSGFNVIIFVNSL